MTDISEIKFGDVRYKQLERNLKLSLLRRSDRSSTSIASPAPTWPSMSSINVDSHDNTMNSPLQNSRNGSEVVAFSSNLRNVMPQTKGPRLNGEKMTTSSVKKFHTKQNDLHDHLIMPPPKFDTVLRSAKKTNPNTESSNNRTPGMERDTVSSVVRDTARSIDSTITSDVQQNVLTANDESNSMVRVFYKWRVMLNEQCQLIIKGRLECGKVARSKPVIRRLSTNKVQSVFKHIYHLQGSIFDERNELPDYVRGKFYNGFPDDWENVYQIWRTFISQGRKVTFRWPTPITDSDDDLNSEVTDLTILHTEPDNAQKSAGNPLRQYKRETYEQPVEISPPSAYPSNHSVEDKCAHDRLRPRMNDSVTQTDNSCLDEIGPAKRKHTNQSDENISDKENATRFTSANVSCCTPTCTTKLKDVIQEDKVRMIINNLADKNCSHEYINKIMEMLDCLNYVVTYKPPSETESRAPTAQADINCCSIPSNSSSQQIGLQRDINYDKRNSMEKIKKHSDIDTEVESEFAAEPTRENKVSFPGSRTTGKKGDGYYSSDNSESETYAGVPKISIERILNAKTFPKRPHRRKEKRRIACPTAVEQNVEANRITNESVNSVPPDKSKTNMESQYHHDSSISITEDEAEIRADQHTQLKTVNVNESLNTISSYYVMNNCKKFSSVHKEESGTRRMHPFAQNEKQINVSSASLQNSLVHTVDTVKTSTFKTNPENSHSRQNVGFDESNARPSNQSNSERNIEKPRTPYAPLKFPAETSNTEKQGASKPIVIGSVPTNLDLRIRTKNLDNNHNANPGNEVRKEQRPNDVQNATRKREGDQKQHSTPDTRAASTKPDPVGPAEAENAKFEDSEKKEKFGSVKNPKVLTAWTPKVLERSGSDSELGLIFEGKLLNEAGHVVRKNYKTDFVRRRLSATLIETADRVYYQLLGDLNVSKHVVPKELLRQCRNGCPAKVAQFCKTWRSLETGGAQEVTETPANTSMHDLSVPVSSRGRRILPPLCYWTGERVALKDNTPVYTAGNSMSSSIPSSLESSKNVTHEEKAHAKNTRQGRSSVEKNKSDSSNLHGKHGSEAVPNKTPGTAKASSGKAATEKVPRKSANTESTTGSWLPASNRKKRIAQQLQFSSDSSDEDASPPAKQRHAHQDTAGRNAETQAQNARANNMSVRDRDGETAHAKFTTKLRKRQKIDAGYNNATSPAKAGKSKSGTTEPLQKRERNEKLIYNYYANVSFRDNILSDDQLSQI